MIDVTIDSLSFNGGRGVGRVDGVVIFVPGTAPGDVVRARVTKTKSNFLEAEVISITTPSPVRRTPPCPVADRCGGCAWQHVTYAEQAIQKQKILVDSLRRITPTPDILPLLAAADEFGYRNRIQLHVERDRWGFYQPRSRELVEFEKCVITEDRINVEYARLSPRDFPAARRVELAMTADGQFRAMPGDRDPAAALFSQVNTAQNLVMKRRIHELITTDHAWFVDLYAGGGNLTETLVARLPGARGYAVELSAAAVARGRAAWPTVEWTASDVSLALGNMVVPPGPGLALLDPPRVGCDGRVPAALARLAPAQIIYVSCNPATFARDAERIIAGGYRLRSVQGLDMFPQTEHVELIASFARETSG